MHIQQVSGRASKPGAPDGGPSKNIVTNMSPSLHDENRVNIYIDDVFAFSLDISQVVDLGVKVGLAVDGSASQDGSNLLEEIRICFLLHRLNSSRQAPTGYDILKLATRGSASLLGRTDIGSLEVGKCADLFMVDSRRLELVGACYDPMSVFGTVGLRQPVDYTIVNGKVTVEGGRLVNVDEEKLARDAQAVCDAYLAKN